MPYCHQILLHKGGQLRSGKRLQEWVRENASSEGQRSFIRGSKIGVSNMSEEVKGLRISILHRK